MTRNREILQKTADNLISTAENLHQQITKTIASLSQSDEDPYGQVRQTKTILSCLAKFLQSQAERAKKGIAHRRCDIVAAQECFNRDPEPDLAEGWLHLRVDQAEAFIAFNAAALRSQIQTVKEDIAEIAAGYADINTDTISLPLKSQVQTLNEKASALNEKASALNEEASVIVKAYLEQFEMAAASSITIGELTCLLFEAAQSPLSYREICWLGYIGHIISELESVIINVHCCQTSAEDDQVLLENIANVRRRLTEDPPQSPSKE
ncbi:MAG: hypothetical protein OXD49_17925 [Candidatus Poribacteria bacterium]|nr:hypothetical protein [Candidatus Poribacteria bacterium]